MGIIKKINEIREDMSLKKISPTMGKIKLKEIGSKLEDALIVGVFTAGIAAIPISYGIIGYTIYETQFDKKYNQALVEYADTNKEGLVFSIEKDNFIIDLLKDKEVTLIPDQMPKYKNGANIPNETGAKWIKE
jgi:hypothetical protein